MLDVLDTLQIPLWLREIVGKQKIAAGFDLFSPDCRIAMVKRGSNNLERFDSIDSLKVDPEQRTRVAFFRDGPFLPRTTGAVASMLGQMNALADRGLDVYLFYCFRGWSNPELYRNKKFSTVFIKPEDFYTNKDLIHGLVASLGISICQFDSAEAVCLQADLVRPDARVVFEVHNVENDLVSQLGGTAKEISYIKDKEAEAVRKADLVLVRSQQNLELIQGLKQRIQQIQIYRGCINTEEIQPTEHTGQNHQILFLGHLNYAPNAQAVELIATQIAPYIDVPCYIAGAYPESLKKKFSTPSVIFLGRVENLNDIFSRVDIGLAPLITGSGTRLKILDYMAGGIPVIGTELAIEGLEDEIKEAMIVENNINKYPEIINEMLNNPALLARYSKLGLEFVRKYRDCKVCIDDVLDAYAALADATSWQ